MQSAFGVACAPRLSRKRFSAKPTLWRWGREMRWKGEQRWESKATPQMGFMWGSGTGWRLQLKLTGVSVVRNCTARDRASSLGVLFGTTALAELGALDLRSSISRCWGEQQFVGGSGQRQDRASNIFLHKVLQFFEFGLDPQVECIQFVPAWLFVPFVLGIHHTSPTPWVLSRVPLSCPRHL